MSCILYYSKYCEVSKKYLQLLSKSDVQKDIHFICIDKRVKDAQTKMRKVSVVTDPRNDSRIAVGKDPYIKSRKSGNYFSGMQQMAGSASLPYEKNARFTITKDMAQGLGTTTQEAAIIYNKFSDETKRRLAGLRKDLNAFTTEFTIEAAKVGSKVGAAAVNATATAAGTASPSRKTRKTGEDIGRGLEEGMKSRQDDVALVGSQLGQAATGGVKGGVGPIPFRGPGEPGMVAANAPRTGISLADITAKARMNREALLSTQQQKRMAVMNQRMDKLNKGFMSGTFALSALSGVASMAGGNLGKFSQILFQITGPLFALSSIIQLLTGEKIIGVLRNLGKLKLGLIAVAITALAVGIKLVTNSLEKQRMAVEGLSNALTTTKDKAKFLGDFFGTTPNARAGSETVFSAAETKPTERTKIQELKTNAEFQSKYKKDIQAFATATNEQVLLGFQTMALDLRGQGFAKEQIDIIIKSIAEEAGRTEVLLKFKGIDFDLSKEAGAEFASVLAKQVADDFSRVLPDAIGEKSIVKIIGKTAVNLGTVADLTTEQKAKINESGQLLSNILTGIQGQFKAGIIDAKQYNTIINKTIDGIISNANAQLLFQSALKKTNPEIAKVTKGMIDANEIALVYQATLVGFTPKLQGLFAALSGARLFEKSGILAAIKAELLAGEKILEEIYGPGEIDESSGEIKLNALQERTKAIKNQTNSYIILRNAKINEKIATELSNDAEIASLILKNKSSKLLPKIIAQVKEYSKALRENLKVEKELASPSTKFKTALEDLQAQANLRNKIIDIQFAPKIKAENDLLKTQEKTLQDINDEIDKSLDTAKIKENQKIIDANNFRLEQISLKEDAINEKYDKQISALEKIETINQDIANIQKRRISIADALTRGDISAAAQLVQEAKAEQARTASSTQRDALTSSRDAQIKELGRIDIEKQNKQLQLEISTIERGQLFILNEQKTAIEKNIEATGRNIKALELEVDTLKSGAYYSGKTKQEIDDLDDLIKLAESAGIEFDAVLLSQAGNAASLAKALQDAVTAQQNLNSLSKIVSTVPKPEPKPTGFFTTTGAGGVKITTPWDTGAGKSINRSLGGIVPKYMARGGRIGSDTVPAMLTPGEFVMNKKATQRFGPMLSMLNESKYPSMIGNGSSAQVPVNNISTSMNDNSTAVYNYSLGFNINGNNLNANDVARAVMKEIKNVDSQRIRGQRI